MPSVPLNDGALVPNRTTFAPRVLARKSDVSGHYVKHSSRITLLLSGQREGAPTPQYSNGDPIEGILAIARPSGILALEVKVRTQSLSFTIRDIVFLSFRGVLFRLRAPFRSRRLRARAR